MNTLQRILRSGGTDLRRWYKRNIKKPIVLWWERKTNFNPYGVWPEGACPVQAEVILRTVSGTTSEQEAIMPLLLSVNQKKLILE